MRLCDFCGERAGWFKDRHSSCNQRAGDIKNALKQLVQNGALAGKSHAELETEAKSITTDNKLPFDHFREALVEGANDAASQLALQSPITEGELNRLASILKGFGFDEYSAEQAQRRWFGLAALGMSHTLWQVFHGATPSYDGAGHMQFNLHSGEIPIFSTGKVTFAEERTISNNPRTFDGLSLPIGDGIYHHVASSQGHQEHVSDLLSLDVGEMLITTQSIYFSGQKKTLRIPLGHVLRYQAYVEGVGVWESHGTLKVFFPDYNGMETGWFFFNLLTALSKKALPMRALMTT